MAMDELLRRFNEAHIRYLIVGGQATQPHLLAAKQAANRPQDQADIDFLAELQRVGNSRTRFPRRPVWRNPLARRGDVGEDSLSLFIAGGDLVPRGRLIPHR